MFELVYWCALIVLAVAVPFALFMLLWVWGMNLCDPPRGKKRPRSVQEMREELHAHTPLRILFPWWRS